MTYTYKGRGMVQITGNQNMSTTYNINPHSNSYGNVWSGSYNAQAIPQISTSTIQSLSNHNYGNVNTISLGNLFSSSRNMSHDVKKYEIYESPEDILALSVAWKRLRKNDINLGISSLLQQQMFEHLKPEDRETANIIRDYYSKKIMMWKLKGKELTSFRKDLNIFVHEEGTKFKTEMIGLAYYLPEFYEYDSQIDTVREQVKSKGLVTGQDKTLLPLTSMLGPKSKKLTPLKRINRVNKKINHMQYWFKDDETEGAVVINIDSKNPLEHIWNNVFDNSDTLNVKGKYYLKDNEDFEYFSIKNWELQKG
jgi:hypothetical protein